MLQSPKRKLRETTFSSRSRIPSARASSFQGFGFNQRNIKTRDRGFHSCNRASVTTTSNQPNATTTTNR